MATATLTADSLGTTARRFDIDLPDDLRGAVRGEVRFDRGSRALYATDGSNYRQVPIGVVVPRDVDDVVATAHVCQQHSAPILSRGGGTSLAGQCCNVAVVMDMSKYVNRVVSIDAKRKIARVEPGVVLDSLQHEAAKHGLIFGPDPATHTHCTLGGMLGNNSCGVHAVMSQFYGPGARTSDNTQRLEILTYDGLRMWVGPTSDDEMRHIIAAGGRRGQIYRALLKLRDAYGDVIRQRYAFKTHGRGCVMRMHRETINQLLNENSRNTPDRIRTCNPRFRRPMRYPIAPRARATVGYDFRVEGTSGRAPICGQHDFLPEC